MHTAPVRKRISFLQESQIPSLSVIILSQIVQCLGKNKSNILLKNFKFSGFIDLGNGGVGDKHIDIFWGAWTLNFNLKTEKYTERFFDAYGKNNFNKEILKLIAACEVFG